VPASRRTVWESGGPLTEADRKKRLLETPDSMFNLILTPEQGGRLKWLVGEVPLDSAAASPWGPMVVFAQSRLGQVPRRAGGMMLALAGAAS
jgi:hypothetical protein